MNYVALMETRQECYEMIERIDECLAELNYLYPNRVDKKSVGYISGTKKSGTCRRQSMELTNQLVKLRKRG